MPAMMMAIEVKLQGQNVPLQKIHPGDAKAVC